MPPAALLVPLSGPDAALGRSMARAALLAQAGDREGLFTIDSGDAADGAVAAARTALKRGAGLILGPLHAAAVRPVLADVAGRVPVISFSNDERLRESGAFLLGITADQTVAPLVRYARGRGVRRLAALASAGEWGGQVVAAGQQAATRQEMVFSTLSVDGLADRLTAADAPDALLVAGEADAASAAAAARTAGVQLLVAFAGLDPSAAGLDGLDGAWFSAPDPAAFADFAHGYQRANGSTPGVIAGLAYDAATIAAALRRSGATDRAALLAAQHFPGVCGDVRFRADGSAARDMAILAVTQGQFQLVDHGGLG